MKQLLIVHSSESFMRALCRRLAGEYRITCCTDGLQALALLDRLRPDGLILHTALPWRDGLSVLQQTSHRPPVILVTTYYLDSFVARRLYRLGATEVFVMPRADLLASRLIRAMEAVPCLLPPAGAALLVELGFSAPGLRPVQLALEHFKNDPGQSLSGAVYPAVGRVLSMQPAAVEKAIRTAIGRAFQNGDPWVWRRYFPRGRCPANREFLLTLLQPYQDRQAADHGTFRDGAVQG